MSEKADSHWVRDSLVEDAIASAKDNGANVTQQDVLDFIVPILESMDQKQSEGRIIKQNRNADKQTRIADAEAAAAEFQARRQDRSGDWTVTKRQADLASALAHGRSLSPIEERMVNRLRALREKPEWRKQMEALVPALNSPNKEARARAELALQDLLARSNTLFGDWRKEPTRTLYF